MFCRLSTIERVLGLGVMDGLSLTSVLVGLWRWFVVRIFVVVLRMVGLVHCISMHHGHDSCFSSYYLVIYVGTLYRGNSST